MDAESVHSRARCGGTRHQPVWTPLSDCQRKLVSDPIGSHRCFVVLGVAVEPAVIRVFPENPDASRSYDENPDDPSFGESTEIEKSLDDGYFPFHYSCLEILALCITRGKHLSSSGYGLDKDAVHLTFTAVQTGGDQVPRLLLLYDLWGICLPGSWECRRGFEYLVADPVPGRLYDSNFESNLITSHPRALISKRDTITETRNYIFPETAISLSAKVRADPFRKVPLEILFQITDLLDNSTLFRLCSASWIVHSITRTNFWFGRHRIRASMPWLTEIAPLLDDTELMSGVDAKGLLCGLSEETRCWEGMSLSSRSLRDMAIVPNHICVFCRVLFRSSLSQSSPQVQKGA